MTRQERIKVQKNYLEQKFKNEKCLIPIQTVSQKWAEAIIDYQIEEENAENDQT